MIYLDSSAIVKLIREEAESSALSAYLAVAPSPPLISSELARVEVHRTLLREGEPAAAHTRAAKLLAPIARLPLAPVIDDAAQLPGPTLRSLDALHLATAQNLGRALTALVTYDHRLKDAADQAGLPTASPS